MALGTLKRILLTSMICFCVSAWASKYNLDCGLLVSSQHSIFLNDTLNSLESMRGANALVADTIQVRSAQDIEILNPDTSPSNIAVDLLIQAELKQTEKLVRILETLTHLNFHRPTGLFFSRYTTDRQSTVTDLSVSAIDNMHLALALFTIQENFRNHRAGELSASLFKRMNFSIYYDPNSGLIGGNLRHQNGKWTREAYNFSHFGSEARLLYSAGWALGLFSEYANRTDFIDRAFTALDVELHHSQEGVLLKLWDGSAFQLYFPSIFMGEENYSPRLREIFLATGDFMIAEGIRRGLRLPAAHSAGRAEILASGVEPSYKDKAGNRELISSGNRDQFDPRLSQSWDTTFTPYALFMAATLQPEKFAPIITQAKDIVGNSGRLYVDGMGWMDGLHVSGPRTDQVIPAQLSLNQGIIALSLLRLRSDDQMNLSARTLWGNPRIRARLQQFYQKFETRL